MVEAVLLIEDVVENRSEPAPAVVVAKVVHFENSEKARRILAW